MDSDIDNDLTYENETFLHKEIPDTTTEVVSELCITIRDYIKENAIPVAEEMTIEDIVNFLQIDLI